MNRASQFFYFFRSLFLKQEHARDYPGIALILLAGCGLGMIGKAKIVDEKNYVLCAMTLVIGIGIGMKIHKWGPILVIF